MPKIKCGICDYEYEEDCLCNHLSRECVYIEAALMDEIKTILKCWQKSQWTDFIESKSTLIPDTKNLLRKLGERP